MTGNEDWMTKTIMEFSRENNVTVIVKDELKTGEKKVILRKGKYEVDRLICYDFISTLLPTVLLNEMLNELFNKISAYGERQ